jgi:hypothetical protein
MISELMRTMFVAGSKAKNLVKKLYSHTPAGESITFIGDLKQIYELLFSTNNISEVMENLALIEPAPGTAEYRMISSFRDNYRSHVIGIITELLSQTDEIINFVYMDQPEHGILKKMSDKARLELLDTQNAQEK